MRANSAEMSVLNPAHVTVPSQPARVGQRGDLPLVFDRFERPDRVEAYRDIGGLQTGHGFEQHLDAFAGAKQRNHSERQHFARPIAASYAIADGHAVRHLADTRCRNATLEKMLPQACRDGDQARRGVQAEFFGKAVAEIPQAAFGVPFGRTMDVVHHRHARDSRDQASHQGRAGRVCMQQANLTGADQARQAVAQRKVDAGSHRHCVDGRIEGLPLLSEDACL